MHFITFSKGVEKDNSTHFAYRYGYIFRFFCLCFWICLFLVGNRIHRILCNNLCMGFFLFCRWPGFYKTPINFSKGAAGIPVYHGTAWKHVLYYFWTIRTCWKATLTINREPQGYCALRFMLRDPQMFGAGMQQSLQARGASWPLLLPWERSGHRSKVAAQ